MMRVCGSVNLQRHEITRSAQDWTPSALAPGSWRVSTSANMHRIGGGSAFRDCPCVSRQDAIRYDRRKETITYEDHHESAA